MKNHRLPWGAKISSRHRPNAAEIIRRLFCVPMEGFSVLQGLKDSPGGVHVSTPRGCKLTANPLGGA